MKSPFNNPKIRAALNFTIERQELVKGVYGGGQPIAAYIVPGLVGYDPSLPANPYDPTKARSLLREGGYTGTEIDFIVPQGIFDKSQEVSEAVVGMMEDVGFRVKMITLELGTWVQRRNSGDYRMYMIDTEAVTGDPDRFLTNNIANDLTRTGYRNEELFSLIRQAGSETDQSKRAALYQRIQRVMFEEPSSHIFLYVPIHRHVERRAVQGFVMPPTGMWRLEGTSVTS
jgi:peptide/nickel transport system substrate-binding protein